ncbi:MAG: hypothetical protein QOE89_341 [Pseudonocardiales bacterium]|jgi:hypothetical protein|nr:hypothetical protein [Pseudonocardiales bacterium]
MTSSLTPAVDTADSLYASTDLPTDPVRRAGRDRRRIAAAMSAALAESTRAVYAHAWRCWEVVRDPPDFAAAGRPCGDPEPCFVCGA